MIKKIFFRIVAIPIYILLSLLWAGQQGEEMASKLYELLALFIPVALFIIIITLWEEKKQP